MSEPLWRWSAHTLAAAIRHGAVSAHEAAIATLERVQAVNPALNAIVDLRGRATTNGVVAFKDNLATEDSPVVANLRRAGAVVIARTNTPAFSVRWFTENDLHGRTLNPWSAAHTPGGSSGGASSAVAAGMGAIAHGNDLAGSVRYPAYCTGVCGRRRPGRPSGGGRRAPGRPLAGRRRLCRRGGRAARHGRGARTVDADRE